MKRGIVMAVLLLVGLSEAASSVHAQSVDLTGLWQDNTGGGAVYRVRQIDDYVYWSVDATAVRSFANVFVGTIEGTIITGYWVDLPGSPALSGGALTLRIDSNNHLVKIDESAAYGAQEWFRQGSERPGTGAAGTVARAIDWSYSPQDHRGSVGQRYAYLCPPNGTLGRVWGTDVYTDDSSLCTAAVHAGLITLAGGGSVIIEIVAGQGAYAGSTRNGVSTLDYGGWPGSFRFVR
jgi:LCCL domain